MPDPAPMLETLVLQPTPFCNIACTYCYLPDRDDRRLMTAATVEASFARVFESGWAAPDLTVIWHAGEPLVAPIAFYEDALATAERLRPPTVRVRHSIQTNGMLLNAAWCDFLRRHDVGIGVSLDGPRALHDAYRVGRNGRGTFDRTMAGIRLLQDHGVPFHVITVLSRDSLAAPEELVAFYRQAGIDQVCFNVEESEGDHVSALFAAEDLRPRFARFLDRFWRCARESGGFRFIREIDGMLPRILRPEEAPLRNEQVVPFGILSIGCTGDAATFSPELLGLRNAACGDFLIGNVHTHSLAQMRDSLVLRTMARDIAAGVARCRDECPYFSVCGGGAPVNKLTENGGFATTRTRFCELTQMVPTDLILDAVERMELADRPAAAGVG
ncbi:MAG: hypothetical protein BGO51_17955 [Rhodospirillales bacterium 69-11]|nr:GRRM system radical SAM/SPASM domain protein [Rhodospirillales bacterium]OJW20627.1 MAG: hypothetical protein BGO51_17955 [Rhodospirillales bacterium 69-11]